MFVCHVEQGTSQQVLVSHISIPGGRTLLEHSRVTGHQLVDVQRPSMHLRVVLHVL